MLTKKAQIKRYARLRGNPSKKYMHTIPPESELDMLNKDIVILLNPKDKKRREEYLWSKEVCQVCEKSYQLDKPHHARYGLGSRDDRYLVNICVYCHDIIHRVGYSKVAKSREEIENIGWDNNIKMLEVFRLYHYI